MFKFLTICILIIIFHSTAMAQVINGKLIDGESGEPLGNASVFLAGTLIGTTTYKSGNFELDTKGNNLNPIVISFVGYETKTFSKENIEGNPTITLTKKTKTLGEINIQSTPDSWSRKKKLRVFKNQFLGTSSNALSCKILNENDIYLFYNDSTKILHAHSNHPLIIVNKMLGYKMTYLLESFQCSQKVTGFRGYNSFEELEPDFKSLKKRIIAERKDAYYGSIMHFLRYLYNDNIHEDDTIYTFTLIYKGYCFVAENIKIISEIKPQRSFDAANMDTIDSQIYTEADVEKVFRQFHLYDTTGNYLTNRRILYEDGNTKKLSYPGKIRIKYFPKSMTTYLLPKTDSIEIAKNGYYDPDLIKWSGSMSRYRVGDLLPFDYYPEYDN